LYQVKVEKVNTLIRPDARKKAFIKLTSEFEALDVAYKIGIL
jgi:large subunit ribosomal protein L23Ae